MHEQERQQPDDQVVMEDSDRSTFATRHIGPSDHECKTMLSAIGYDDLEQFTEDLIPSSIRDSALDGISQALSEEQALRELRHMAVQNEIYTSYIGQGFYNCYTPPVIQRNVLENPAWYTAYTPYQPEISQGRLEALLNFQTMVCELTGMAIANASMLDEATACAEAVAMCRRTSRAKSTQFFVDHNCMPQTLDVIRTRAAASGVNIVVGPSEKAVEGEYFGVLLATPGADGGLLDVSAIANHVHSYRGLVVVTTDLLASVLLKTPAQMGADIVIGNTQRFGVPLGFGGPHAAFMAATDKLKRSLPGRIVGVSVDKNGDIAYRLALQTREQHIRREKATSNICTAQVLLAVMAGMFAVYHGASGLQRIAQKVHRLTNRLAASLQAAEFELINTRWFDTLTISTGERTQQILERAKQACVNLRHISDSQLGLSLDQTTDEQDLEQLINIFCGDYSPKSLETQKSQLNGIPVALKRETAVLKHPVFFRHRSETQMLRYLRTLADKDIALDRSMIPLGSCTMKLNATSEMMPVSWPEFSALHPFVPAQQATGYIKMIEQLEQWLCAITGYAAVSLQPNAGSQGEFAGLLAIRAYHESRGDQHRDVCLIPASAHGTNPASAHMCNMKVVVVECTDDGYIDINDLAIKAENFAERLAAIMITYPSTYGIFEEQVSEVCALVHQHGGQVYVDGANLNAMVGMAKPGRFGGDVSHLNLHKTFCIPHGGGGPGVGPLAVAEHLKPFLPDHRYGHGDRDGQAVRAVAAAPWGSASILPISWMYIRMMGAQALRKASQVATLSANYIAARLKDHYKLHFTDKRGLVAHECIIDLRRVEKETSISSEDIAKRLIDYGFHAPTMSFPVAGTLMIEPTESESLEELDRFVEAMIAIRREIDKVASKAWPIDDNPLVNAPHTAHQVCQDDWSAAYTREQACYPVASLRHSTSMAKYWPPVARVDNVYGDRNLVCSCPSLTTYVDTD